MFQFTVTQIFIIGTFVVLQQMHYFRNVDLGFIKEGIVSVRLANDYQEKVKTLRDRVQSIGSVSKVSMSFFS